MVLICHNKTPKIVPCTQKILLFSILSLLQKMTMTFVENITLQNKKIVKTATVMHLLSLLQTNVS